MNGGGHEAKSLSELSVADFEQFPVWEHVYDEEEYPDETWGIPVTELPVDTLEGRIIGVQIELNNAEQHWAGIGNIDLQDERRTEHLLSISVEKDGVFFPLARYFDVDYDTCGPRQLAESLRLPINAVFPISYDFSHLVRNARISTKREVPQEPAEKLTWEQILELIFHNNQP